MANSFEVSDEGNVNYKISRPKSKSVSSGFMAFDTEQPDEVFRLPDLPRNEDGPIFDPPHVELPSDAEPLPGGGYRVPIPGRMKPEPLGPDVYPRPEDYELSDDYEPIGEYPFLVNNEQVSMKAVAEAQEPPNLVFNSTLVVKSWHHDESGDLVFVGDYADGRPGTVHTSDGHMSNLVFDSNYLDAGFEDQVKDLFKDNGSVFNCTFNDIDLNLCNFKGTDISSTSFCNCGMALSNFEKADIKICTFDDCDLNSSLMRGAKFSNCSFKDCSMKRIVDTNASFTGCTHENCISDESKNYVGLKHDVSAFTSNTASKSSFPSFDDLKEVAKSINSEKINSDIVNDDVVNSKDYSFINNNNASYVEISTDKVDKDKLDGFSNIINGHDDYDGLG